MNLHWSHVALNCRDQQATEDFYREWFGFERARAVPLGAEQIVFLRQGNVYLELFRATAGAGAEPTADGPRNAGDIRHIAFQADDLDAFLTRIGDAVPISLGPLSFEDFIPGWRTVWLTDPDGVIVEVSQGYRDD
jgi:glyoxylase I family protein